jgi:hypothetical protein
MAITEFTVAYNCYKFITVLLLNRLRAGAVAAVSLQKPPCAYGGYRSETATWIQKWLKIFVGTSRTRKL